MKDRKYGAKCQGCFSGKFLFQAGLQEKGSLKGKKQNEHMYSVNS